MITLIVVIVAAWTLIRMVQFVGQIGTLANPSGMGVPQAD
jgi:hypothetical protein